MLKQAPYAPVETLQSALAYLMSRHNMITSLQLQECSVCSAISVAQHLGMLIRHPQLNSTVLQGTYMSLLSDWQRLAQHHEQQAAIKYQSDNREQLQIH